MISLSRLCAADVTAKVLCIIATSLSLFPATRVNLFSFLPG
ncbi:MAG: hypothetical protein GPOALKHO_001829 [Sodalis sp.]|nr:MAG: hypothetical protein GPOALKHO_001829 [Sodalis sp.]